MRSMRNVCVAGPFVEPNFGRVVVYVPGAPDPWSGAVFVMTADRVEPLEASMPAAVKNIRALGRGTTRLLNRTK